MKTNVGLWRDFNAKWDDWRRATIPNDPINFKPSTKPQGKLYNVDPDQLGIYAEGDKLFKLTQQALQPLAEQLSPLADPNLEDEDEDDFYDVNE